MKLMEVKFLKRGKPVRTLWDFADYLRDLKDGWEPYHWSANWKVLQTQGNIKLYLELMAKARSGLNEPIITAEICARDNPPNQSGMTYDLKKLEDSKNYAINYVVPKIKDLLDKSGMRYEILMEIE